MTIEKLPSGNYRIKEMRDGKTYRITLDHKPTKAEARDLIQEKASGFNDSTIFYDAANNYIKSKENVLSPATIRGYRSLVENMDPKFVKKPIDAITLPVLQTLINEFSLNHSPKSVRNLNGFIISVLKYYGSDVKSPTLPQKEVKNDYIPTENDVKRLLNEFKGTKYEPFIILATMGLRRSEICALTPDDLKGNVLTIDKALVMNDKKQWVVKKTKTVDSTRTIIIPDYVANLLRTNGFYKDNPETLYFALRRVQKRLGIPLFSLHKLRHFFASYMHDLGYSDKQIQEFGGWKTDEVMKKVYQHAMEMDKAKLSMSNNINGLLS